MSWLFTLTRLLLVGMLLIWVGSSSADTLESAIMPGKVIRGHADYEGECGQCHVRFDRAAQQRLCLDCHKPVAADIRNRQGYHGRLKEQQCRACHTDHKGRQARIVQFDEKQFDHTQTDFSLLGKHRKETCSSCHRPNAKYRAAPADCATCHRKDDRHKGGLGQKCENCHGQDTWKEGRFDHGKTRFALLLRHAKTACVDCHPKEHYTETPRECNACHRSDDAHKGGFGPRCDNCHNAAEWKQPIFRHERDTRYPLLDRHRQVKCGSCHKAPLYREKTPTRCNACHREDDTHRGTLGDKCEKCHSERGWKSAARFDHDHETDFPLRDKHKQAKCDSCHRSVGEKLPTRCFSCHEQDDQKKGHKGHFGEKCASCHNEKGFKHSVFDHDKDTPFALNGKHRKTKCNTCHRTPLYSSRTENTCFGCHKNEDIHFGSFTLNCQHCHEASDWRKIIERRLIPPDMLKFLPDPASKP